MQPEPEGDRLDPDAGSVSPDHAVPPQSPRSSEVADSERHLVIAKLEAAVGAGALALEDFIRRLDTVWAATSQEDLAVAMDAVPQAPPVGGGRLVARTVNLFGDEHRSGIWRPARTVTVINVFSDTTLDLRGAHCTSDEVIVRSWSTFGDVELIVPDGGEVDLSGCCVFGDRTVDVAPVARVPGAPRVRLVAYSLFGDAGVRSDSRLERRKKKWW